MEKKTTTLLDEIAYMYAQLAYSSYANFKKVRRLGFNPTSKDSESKINLKQAA